MISKASKAWGRILDGVLSIREGEKLNQWQKEWQTALQNGNGFFDWAFNHIPKSANVKLSVLPGEVVAILAEHCGGNVEDWQLLCEQWGDSSREYCLAIEMAEGIKSDIKTEVQEWEETVKSVVNSAILQEEGARYLQKRICRALFDLGKQRRMGFDGVSRHSQSYWKNIARYRTGAGWLALAGYAGEAWEKLKIEEQGVNNAMDGAAMQFRALFLVLQTSIRREPKGEDFENPQSKEQWQMLILLHGQLLADGWLQKEDEKPKQTAEEFASVILSNGGEIWFCGGKSELSCLLDTLTENGYLPKFSEMGIEFLIMNKGGGNPQVFTLKMYEAGRKFPRKISESSMANGQTNLPKILQAIGKLLDEPERIRQRKKELAEYGKNSRMKTQKAPR